jgi:chromosome transmission fidelity protein 1
MPHVEIAITREGKILKYIVLNPAEYFEDLTKQCRAVILAGGTMEPVEDLLCQLMPQIPRERLHHLSCGHVVPADHLLAVILRSGPSNIPFCFTHETRYREDLVSIV